MLHNFSKLYGQSDKIKVFYRLSDAGYPKEKPSYINNQECLINFMKVFEDILSDINIYADNISPETERLLKFVTNNKINHISCGSSAASFRHVLNLALQENDDTIIYFVENDYLHKPNSKSILLEGIKIADYVTLYDHPDKYRDGVNPGVSGGGERTRVLLTKSTHWKFTNSTTMTFACTCKTLKEDASLINKFISGTHPNDYEMFVALGRKGRTLASPIPGYSTHGETQWLAPLINWEQERYYGL